MRAQLTNCLSADRAMGHESTVSRPGSKTFVETMLGDLDSGTGLIDLTIPGVGQTLDEITGL